MKKQLTTENIIITIGIVMMAIALGLLFNIAKQNDQRQLDALANLHAQELAHCWNEIEDGQICKIEYIKDRTNTVVSAKVIKEEVGK